MGATAQTDRQGDRLPKRRYSLQSMSGLRSIVRACVAPLVRMAEMVWTVLRGLVALVALMALVVGMAVTVSALLLWSSATRDHFG